MRDKIQTKGEDLTEYEGMLKLTEFRAKGDLYMGDSFETILSTGANGAIIHYTATAEECKNLDPNDMILCDSGGHYKDGTTDTTRTIHYSQPTPYQREMYTRVLRGNLDYERFKFPAGRGYS